MIDGTPRGGVRGRVLDWAWNHPRWKRRMREVWGSSREGAALIGLPRPFDPPEWAALRRLATSASPPEADAKRILFMSWRGWSDPPRHRDRARPRGAPAGLGSGIRLLRGPAPNL